MESYQPPPRYMRPPLAPPSDHHLPPHHPPPTGSWFSGQFQFHPSHSPSPPPLPHQNQWGPPPPPPPHHHHAPPYAAQSYPPPPPPPPRPSPAPLPPHYPQLNQGWGHANWTHHSGWEYPAHSNEDDWAARARAWASARLSMENQPPQSQFTSTVGQEEASQYSSQYSEHFENHYHDIRQTTISTPGFQNYQAPVHPRPPLVHQQDPNAISSYAAVGNFSFAAKDETPGTDISAAVSHHQGPTSSSVNRQEVPSSYSSFPGKEGGLEGQQHGHLLVPADSGSVPLDQSQFSYGNHSLDPMDQPLEFALGFGHENDLKMKSSYADSLGPAIGTDFVAPVPSLHAWTASITPSVSYPPITPAFPSAPQHESSIGIPPLAEQPAPMFGRGSGFQPAVPSSGSPIGLGAGSALHPTAVFPVDAHGASLGPERPKKAAVPNWLREEIIKNKAAITNPTNEQLKEGVQPMEDDSIDKPTGKSDQADSKIMDSSRSTEEDDDEDHEEAKRTAAINQEVKRIVTEVLLKVTDELFDEIATKVLSEDDLTFNGMPNPDNLAPNRQASPPPRPVPAPMASAKVLVPAKAKKSETENASGESSSGSPGNVLGLVNYASDDDDDNEKQTSSAPKSDSIAGQNGHQWQEAGEHHKSPLYAEGDHVNGKSIGAQSDHVVLDFKVNDHRMNSRDLDNGGDHQFYSRNSVDEKGGSVADNGKSRVELDVKLRDNSQKTSNSRHELPAEKHGLRKSSEDSQVRDTRRHDRHDMKRISSGRHIMEKIEVSKDRKDGKEEIHGGRDGRHKDTTEDNNNLKYRSRDQGGKHREKTRESDSRNRSPLRDIKDDKNERQRDKKTSGRDDVDKKRERAKDEKGYKFRHKSSNESRHKRRGSSPIGNRAKRNKESPVVSDSSNDEASEHSRSKVHSKRRDLSPSPTRARRRQVSRSPSKHTQRRHSPYSSLDGSRGRRSRSRSPVRKHR